MAPIRTPEDAAWVAASPNAEQIEYWNEITGHKWVAVEARLDAQISPFGLMAMERAKLAADERVLDVGCGTGQTSIQLAGRVGPAGSVTGIDVSRIMLARAESRAGQASFANIEFLHADAQVHRFQPGSFDLLFSRFGVMFFSDPRAAFVNLRRALAPGGRLVFACWQDISRNPWMSEPLRAVGERLELPPPPPPHAPGPFAFADAERVRDILESAGFGSVAFESVLRPLLIGGGGTLGDAVTFLLEVGPAAAALREWGRAERGTVAKAVRESLRGYATQTGVVMDSAAWIFVARNPG